MSKLLILCVDGLDPSFASDNGFNMEYEVKLSVPSELCTQVGRPWTPLVWPSLFSGELELNYLVVKKTNRLRLKVRNFLISCGIQWRRDGFRIALKRKVGYRLIHMPRVAESLVIDDYTSFLYHVPCVSNDYFYGIYPDYAELEWAQFNVMALFSKYLDKDIVAIYTRIIDSKGHAYIEGNEISEDVLRRYYREVFELVDILKGWGDVMLLSDHGTVGDHTESAYLGCTRPVKAESVLDVREDIESILNEKTKYNIMQPTTARITLNR